jgi:sugar phosphate isomerase/epimerase
VARTYGGRSITVAESAGSPLDVGVAAEAFGAICDRAAALELLVHLEFWPGSRLDLATAVGCVRRAARPNGGLLLDAWHVHRTAGGLAALAEADGVPILAVQLSDGPLAASGEYMDETMHRRRVPGDGEFDLVGLVRSLARRGVTAPLGVEVLSD